MTSEEKQLIYNLEQLHKNKNHYTYELNRRKDQIRVALNEADDNRFDAALASYLKNRELIVDTDFHINKIKDELGIII